MPPDIDDLIDEQILELHDRMEMVVERRNEERIAEKERWKQELLCPRCETRDRHGCDEYCRKCAKEVREEK